MATSPVTSSEKASGTSSTTSVSTTSSSSSSSSSSSRPSNAVAPSFTQGGMLNAAAVGVMIALVGLF